MDILEGKHISGSYDKLMIGDIVISLSRGRKDRLEGTGRWHFLGNRYGLDGVTYASTIDTSMGHITIDEDELDLDNNDKVTSKDGMGMFSSEKTYLKNQFFKMER